MLGEDLRQLADKVKARAVDPDVQLLCNALEAALDSVEKLFVDLNAVRRTVRAALARARKA